MEYVGSPEQVLKIQGSINCQVCCEKGTYIEAMKKDSLNLFEGNVTVDVDYNLSNHEDDSFEQNTDMEVELEAEPVISR